MESAIENSRGILHLKAGEQKFRLSRHLPAQDLRFFIEFYWIVAWDLRGQEPYVQETLPYPSVHLIIEKDRSKIYGVVTGKFTRLLEGAGHVFGIKFRPGAFYPFVKSPVATFTNRCVSLRDVFGVDGATLEAAMLACEDESEMQAVAERFLSACQPERDEHVTQINQVIDHIITHTEITRVDDVVSQLHLNKRTLQRLFSQYVGVSPKWVIKRYRLHEVAERLASGVSMDWAQMAVDLGYFDQAHFIKDFKAIVGKTPTEYVKNDG